jgi:hypothetical protein
MSFIQHFFPVVVATLCFVAAPLRADYATNFDQPPYVANQTVIGRDGWDYRLPTTEDRSNTARVVPVRWHKYQPALMLKGANLKSAFAQSKGEKVTIIFELALTFPDSGPTGKQFRLGFFGAPCGEIFMDLSPTGGLGYQADGSGRGGLVALKKDQVKVNSFYTFTVVIDYGKMTYDLTITGVNKDGTPFHHESEAISFESKSKSVTGLYLLSGGALTGYLKSLSIQSR